MVLVLLDNGEKCHHPGFTFLPMGLQPNSSNKGRQHFFQAPLKVLGESSWRNRNVPAWHPWPMELLLHRLGRKVPVYGCLLLYARWEAGQMGSWTGRKALVGLDDAFVLLLEFWCCPCSGIPRWLCSASDGFEWCAGKSLQPTWLQTLCLGTGRGPWSLPDTSKASSETRAI